MFDMEVFNYLNKGIQDAKNINKYAFVSSSFYIIYAQWRQALD